MVVRTDSLFLVIAVSHLQRAHPRPISLLGALAWAVLSFPSEYIITMPNMYARGILFGKMVLELGDTCVAKNEKNGLYCDLEFKTKVSHFSRATVGNMLITLNWSRFCRASSPAHTTLLQARCGRTTQRLERLLGGGAIPWRSRTRRQGRNVCSSML